MFILKSLGLQAPSIGIGFETLGRRIREFVGSGQDLGYGLRDLFRNGILLSHESFGEG